MDITDNYTNYCYDNYYREHIDYDSYYKAIAEKEDREWEDNQDE